MVYRLLALAWLKKPQCLPYPIRLQERQKNLGKSFFPHMPPHLPPFGPFLGAPVAGQTPLEQTNNVLLEKKKDRKNLHRVWKLYWHKHQRRDRFLGWLAEYQLVNSSSVVPYSLASKPSKIQAVRTASTMGSSEVRWQHGASRASVRRHLHSLPRPIIKGSEELKNRRPPAFHRYVTAFLQLKDR